MRSWVVNLESPRIVWRVFERRWLLEVVEIVETLGSDNCVSS